MLSSAYLAAAALTEAHTFLLQCPCPKLVNIGCMALSGIVFAPGGASTPAQEKGRICMSKKRTTYPLS